MKYTEQYDYCIVGAGPTGLTLAYIFASVGKKCIIIDKNADIGGCHRVTRLNGMFTEHGPRIYSNSYINLINLLRNMNINFYDLFVPYQFTISNIGNYTIKNFKLYEMMKLFKNYMILLVKPNHGDNISMKEFMNKNKFTENTKDYIDRLCRLTDGASSERYSLNKFYQLVNQQFLHTIYQPNTPNDKGLFKYWKQILLNKNVDMLLNANVTQLNGTIDNVNEIIVNINDNHDLTQSIKSKQYIFCIPPKPLLDVLSNSIYRNTFGDYYKLNEWVIKSTYTNYIPVSFHWSQNALPENYKMDKVWGFPKSEWGIAFIVLSNYMDFEDNRSKLVISTCVTKTDTISSYIKKTANQCNQNELVSEILRQLKISFPDIPDPSFALINPNVKYMNDKWVEPDTAFIKTYNNSNLSAFGLTKNLYQVGTQNGKSKYGFTTIESAVTNAISFANTIEPNTKNIIIVKNDVELNSIIRIILFILLILIIIKFYRRKS